MRYHGIPSRRDTGRTTALATHGLDHELLLALALVIALVCAAVLSGPRAEPVAVTRSVVVGPGDTLWDIARLNPVDNMDTASAVDMICALNGLSGSGIAPGDRLVVPTASDRAVVARR